MSKTAKLLRNNIIEAQFGYDQSLIDQIRLVPERKWDKVSRKWTLKASIKALEFIINNDFSLLEQDVPKLMSLLDKLVEKEQNKSKKILLAKAIEAPVIPEVASLMKIPAYSYQWAPCHYIRYCEGRFLLADDMACGKSVESLMMSNLPEYKGQPVLIVTPVPMNFQKEILKFFGESSIVVTNKEQLYNLNPRVRYYLVAPQRMKWLFDDTIKRRPKPYCQNFFVIVDEAHMYKNKAAQRTKFLRALTHLAKHAVLMTGTPVMNRPDELYELLVALDPNFMSWTTFMRLFCGMQWTPYGMDHSGHSNLQYLNSWLFENIMVRREKAQVLTQLPPKVRQTIELVDTPIECDADSIFELFAKSAEVKSKDTVFLDWLRNAFSESGKIGAFFYHQSMGNAIEALCKEEGYSYIRIDGNQTMEERNACVERFERDPSCKVAILSIACAGVGLNGLQVAQVCVFTQFYWRPGDIIQAEDRFHRPGVPGSVLILYPLLTHFDYALGNLVLEKLSVIRRITSVDGVPDSIDDKSLLNALSAEFGIPIKGKK